MTWFIRILHLVFGGIFVYAGALKAIDPGKFLLDVRSFELLPDPYAAWLALFLPWLEIFCGVAVITGCLRKGGMLILNALLIIFLIVIGISWFRGVDIRCGCFGDSGDASSNYVELMVRDILLLVIGITAVCLKSAGRNPSRINPAS